MLRYYRVTRPDFPMPDGRGAERFGGRWNSPGAAMVYTADTPVTAMLEAGVEQDAHLWRGALLQVFDVPDEMIMRGVADCPADDWIACRRIGDEWLREATTCAVRVRSHNVSGGQLLLLNPAHPVYPLIRVSSAPLLWGARSHAGTPLDFEVGNWFGLVDRHGNPLGGERERRALVKVRSTIDILLGEIGVSPARLLLLQPREFEEVIARFYEKRGWRVVLTPASRDGGKDIVIVKKDEAGTRTCFVECKRNRPDRPVGVELVRRLYGVVERSSATSGILVTTSRFTRGALEEQRSIAHRMELHDYFSLSRLLGPSRGDVD